MVARLKKNEEPEDDAFLKAILVLLNKLPHLTRLLLLPKKIPPLELTWKL